MKRERIITLLGPTPDEIGAFNALVEENTTDLEQRNAFRAENDLPAVDKDVGGDVLEAFVQRKLDLVTNRVYETVVYPHKKKYRRGAPNYMKTYYDLEAKAQRLIDKILAEMAEIRDQWSATEIRDYLTDYVGLENA